MTLRFLSSWLGVFLLPFSLLCGGFFSSSAHAQSGPGTSCQYLATNNAGGAFGTYDDSGPCSFEFADSWCSAWGHTWYPGESYAPPLTTEFCELFLDALPGEGPVTVHIKDADDVQYEFTVTLRGHDPLAGFSMLTAASLLVGSFFGGFMISYAISFWRRFIESVAS